MHAHGYAHAHIHVCAIMMVIGKLQNALAQDSSWHMVTRMYAGIRARTHTHVAHTCACFNKHDMILVHRHAHTWGNAHTHAQNTHKNIYESTENASTNHSRTSHACFPQSSEQPQCLMSASCFKAMHSNTARRSLSLLSLPACYSASHCFSHAFQERLGNS